MITSTANPQVKNLRQLQKKAKVRREEGVFPVEGIRMAREAPDDRIEAVYVSESFLRQPENEAWMADRKKNGGEAGGMYREVLSDAVFANVSDTKTPQGILCLVRMQDCSPEEMFAMSACPGADAGNLPAGLWMVLEGLQDPGNLGTIIRTGEGVGISGVILDTDTVDVYNPKTIRSTMGSIFRVPFLVAEDLPAMLADMRACGIRVFAADGGEGGVLYTEADYAGPTAFLVGNEGNGLSAAALAAADTSVRIPMRGQLESLNASTAASILLYEADRQRRE